MDLLGRCAECGQKITSSTSRCYNCDTSIKWYNEQYQTLPDSFINEDDFKLSKDVPNFVSYTYKLPEGWMDISNKWCYGARTEEKGKTIFLYKDSDNISFHRNSIHISFNVSETISVLLYLQSLKIKECND